MSASSTSSFASSSASIASSSASVIPFTVVASLPPQDCGLATNVAYSRSPHNAADGALTMKGVAC